MNIISPRAKAISTALLRRLRDRTAILIVGAAHFIVAILLGFGGVAFLIDCLCMLAIAKPAILPAHIHLPMLVCGLVFAFGWIFYCRPCAPPLAVPGNMQPAPFLSRATTLCARGPHIFKIALEQFLADPSISPSDPRTLSLFQRYRNRLSASGRGSILAAIAIFIQAIPGFFIAFGLMVLAIVGSIAVFLLGLATLVSGSPSPSHSLVSVRGWASRMADCLVAEGSSDLAASEAALLDQSLPASPTAGKPPRL